MSHTIRGIVPRGLGGQALYHVMDIVDTGKSWISGEIHDIQDIHDIPKHGEVYIRRVLCLSR
jgi:hypothetical protein